MSVESASVSIVPFKLKIGWPKVGSGAVGSGAVGSGAVGSEYVDGEVECTEESEVLMEPADHLMLKKDYYMISNLGRIWSCSLKKFLDPVTNPNGYVTPVLILTTGVSKTLYLHILVMETFNQETPEGLVIDHKNQVKGDNRLINLRFATLSENIMNRDWSNHGVGQKKPVLRYTLDGIYLDEWASARDAMAGLKLNGFGPIVMCCLNTGKTGYGFTWKYKEVISIPTERWKIIYGVEISDHGRVRNQRSSVVTYGSITNNGYYEVGRGGKNHLVHRLVCEAFNGKAPIGKDSVDHVDGDKTHNRFDNLQWVSHTENMQRAVGKKVVRNKDGIDEVFSCISEAMRVTGHDNNVISEWCRGHKTSNLYAWRFLDEEDANVKNHGPNCKAVIQCSKEGNEVRRFDTMIETARTVNRSRKTIREYIKSGKPLDGFIYKQANL
jgi:hypothetical protein